MFYAPPTRNLQREYTSSVATRFGIPYKEGERFMGTLQRSRFFFFSSTTLTWFFRTCLVYQTSSRNRRFLLHLLFFLSRHVWDGVRAAYRPRLFVLDCHTSVALASCAVYTPYTCCCLLGAFLGFQQPPAFGVADAFALYIVTSVLAGHER